MNNIYSNATNKRIIFFLILIVVFIGCNIDNKKLQENNITINFIVTKDKQPVEGAEIRIFKNESDFDLDHPYTVLISDGSGKASFNFELPPKEDYKFIKNGNSKRAILKFGTNDTTLYILAKKDCATNTYGINAPIIKGIYTESEVIQFPYLRETFTIPKSNGVYTKEIIINDKSSIIVSNPDDDDYLVFLNPTKPEIKMDSTKGTTTFQFFSASTEIISGSFFEFKNLHFGKHIIEWKKCNAIIKNSDSVIVEINDCKPVTVTIKKDIF